MATPSPSEEGPEGEREPESASDAEAAALSDSLDDALARCYRHLGRREHSTAELRERLGRAKVDADTIHEALAIVTDQGYLDDERYARMLAEDRRSIDGWGVDRIRERLVRAGVDREIVDATLAAFDHRSECDAAVALLSRRVRASPQTDAERQRAFAILIRQGYDSDVAYDAVRRFQATQPSAGLAMDGVGTD